MQVCHIKAAAAIQLSFSPEPQQPGVLQNKLNYFSHEK